MSVGYFFLRPKKPAAKEPNPSKPSNGSGEAVCGSFCPAFAFWSAAWVLSAAVEFLSAEVEFWSAAVALLEGVAFWSVPVVLLAGGFCAVVVLEAAAFWSVLVVLEGAVVLEAAAFWSAVVLLEGAAVALDAVELWSVVLVLEVDVLGAVVLEAAAFWSVEVAGGVVLEAAAFWSVELVLLAGGFTGALALSLCVGAWVVLVVAAGALALLVSVVGVWALPGAAGVVLLVAVEEEAALWSLAEAGAEAVDVLEAGAAALAADWSAAEVPAAAPVLAAWLLVQESEIILTELTCSEPSLLRVPWTWTWCPSCGFSMELSPCRFTLWPLSAASTQFPPDCFRQPRMELDWSLVADVLVAVEFVWSVVDGVDGEVDGLVVAGCWLDWSGVVLGVEPELPVCANAIPVVSISAKINFLFMSLLLRICARMGLVRVVPANVRWG
jgi:hypothetical protein